VVELFSMSLLPGLRQISGRLLVSKFFRLLDISLCLLVLAIFLGASTLPPGDRTESVRAFTRNIEFDYVGWTLNALWVKLNQLALGSENYLNSSDRHQAVLEYLSLVTQIQQGEGKLSEIFGDPTVTDKQAATQPLRMHLDDLRARRDRLSPVAEAILQSQVSDVVSSLGLTLGGQPVPPVLYHSTSPPWALIVSPRNVIRQDHDISLLPDTTVDKQTTLEEQVDKTLNVSSLVVGIGGIGVYPTMVDETNDLDWLSEVVSHEWTHNFLELRPLGISYLTSPQLRIMNETTASIAGKEIGRAVLERYYPELVPPPPPPPVPPSTQPVKPAVPPEFDFNKEMHETRVNVDKLLAEGKVDEAEQYMEAQRVVFWNQGYHFLRKLNQAYFAFYGAYADQPGGAAGEDPVGAAVRALRARSSSLSEFLNRISWMSSFEQLQKAIEGK
jgi:hypothetical protein